MSMSAHDTDSSNIDSPLSFLDSPYSSPSQQVPHLAYSMTELRCNDGKPYLRIIEQPQYHFRFRYKSEMVGTHGSLLGESSANGKNKSHPTVELVNFTGRAVIKCRLAQHETDEEHPHKLLEDEHDKNVSYVVPEKKSYRVGFAGMGIIHTAKKQVPRLLFIKYTERMSGEKINLKDLRNHCENQAKNINLNIVRLRFSAHDIDTDTEICPPVFSRPIYNMKCASTNDLKICRISRNCGSASGGEYVYVLVEKVNRKNIKIRFFELDENGKEIWSDYGIFREVDVHHQYAIVFRTPPYADVNTPINKNVYIELVRTTDGRKSDRVEFEYKAAPAHKGTKKRKTYSTCSSLNSTEGSLKSIGEVPATVLFMSQNPNDQLDNDIKDINMFSIPQIPQIPKSSRFSESDLGDALYGVTAEGSPSENNFYDSPMLPQDITGPPDLQLNSAELEQILKDNRSLSADEKERFCNTNWSEYLKLYDSMNDETNSFRFDIVKSMLATDGLKPSSTNSNNLNQSHDSKGVHPSSSQDRRNVKSKTDTSNDKNSDLQYTAFYKAEDGSEVKKLVKELCDIIRDKDGVRKQVVREKLERLCQMRLSNGDTFLHMTLCTKQPSLDYIVKLIHNMNMTNLLNLTNENSQTILHLAILRDMPNIVPFLVSKGCSPMIEDKEGNNVLHLAVIYQSCLEILLKALKDNNVSYDLNAYNNEKQAPLHLAVMNKNAAIVNTLLTNGASYNVRDSEGRTPLHLAVCDDSLAVVQAIIEYVPWSDIDALDTQGYSALQLGCDGEIRDNTIAIVKLLLHKKADPIQHGDSNVSAWHMTKDKPSLRQVFRDEIHGLRYLEDEVKSEPDDIKSESEDDFESGEEGESTQDPLGDLSWYLDELSVELDATGGWQKLAAKLQFQPESHSWYSNTNSPSRALLQDLKDFSGTTTSESLAALLQQIGETKAANIVRQHLV